MAKRKDTRRVIAALKKTPPARLELFDLIGETCKPNGELDYNKLGNMSDRLNLAEVQAASYIKGTRSAIHALLSLTAIPRKEGVVRGI